MSNESTIGGDLKALLKEMIPDPPVDYKALLKKYIAHVMKISGWHHMGTIIKEDFTYYERRELYKIVTALLEELRDE